MTSGLACTFGHSPRPENRSLNNLPSRCGRRPDAARIPCDRLLRRSPGAVRSAECPRGGGMRRHCEAKRCTAEETTMTQGQERKPYNVLFLCTGNSARSVMAEVILNRAGQCKFRAFSAGIQPKAPTHPDSHDMLRKLNDNITCFT